MVLSLVVTPLVYFLLTRHRQAPPELQAHFEGSTL
jgi:hypothetical protein